MERTLFGDEHRLFRDAVRAFVKQEIVPFHGKWEEEGLVPRELWTRAGRAGLLCMAVPEAYGGPGVADFRYNAIVDEELARVGATGPGFAVRTDIVLPYLLAYGDEAQKRRWLPGMVSGETIAAIAMTEPGAGSDLAGLRTTATPDGDHYLLDGSKTFITNGIHADLVAVAAVASCEAVLEATVRYARERKAFGQAIGSFQHSRFQLAELRTEIEIGRVFVDRCIAEHDRGALRAEEASMAKWWTTDLQNRVMDRCLQLHGGYGYMREYAVARAFVDTRVASIYAGTNEIMKELIGRTMGL